jgi:hypothetical protein
VLYRLRSVLREHLDTSEKTESAFPVSTAGIWHTFLSKQHCIDVLFNNGIPIFQNFGLPLIDLVLDECCFVFGSWLSILFIGHLVEFPHFLLSDFVDFGAYQQNRSLKFVFFEALEEFNVGLLK